MLLHSINQVRLSDRCEYVQVISQALQREQLPGDIPQIVDGQYLEAASYRFELLKGLES